jgi:hypothetical protein
VWLLQQAIIAAPDRLFTAAMSEMEWACGDTFASRQGKPLATEYAAAVVALRAEEQKARESKR